MELGKQRKSSSRRVHGGRVMLRLLISSLILCTVITGKLLTKAGGRDVVSSEEAQLVREVDQTKDTKSRHIRDFGDGGHGLRSRKMTSVKGINMGASNGGGLEKEVAKGERRVERRLVSHVQEEDSGSGFVAFSEDYYQPTHHPPKNY